MCMGRVRVKISSAGARAVLSSAGVQADLDARAARIKAAADAMTPPARGASRNPDHVVASGGGSRARSAVIAANPHSIASNSRRNTLLKSIDAGR